MGYSVNDLIYRELPHIEVLYEQRPNDPQKRRHVEPFGLLDLDIQCAHFVPVL